MQELIEEGNYNATLIEIGEVKEAKRGPPHFFLPMKFEIEDGRTIFQHLYGGPDTLMFIKLYCQHKVGDKFLLKIKQEKIPINQEEHIFNSARFLISSMMHGESDETR